MLKFKRQSPGHYVSGNIEIKKGVGVDQDKWFCYFPDGKVSYRRSYEAAKAWADKYMEKLKEYQSTKKEEKEQNTVKTVKEFTLKEKLSRHLSYVVGVEWLGCINSGNAACILHLSVNGKSHYLVSKEGVLTDTIFERITFKIKRDLIDGIAQKTYTSSRGEVLVFDDFKKAENAYRELNQKTIDSNDKGIKAIHEAKAKASKGDLEAMFTLGDYGVI